MCSDWFVSLHASSSKRREIASETQSRGGSLDLQDSLCKHAHTIDSLHEECNSHNHFVRPLFSSKQPTTVKNPAVPGFLNHRTARTSSSSENGGNKAKNRPPDILNALMVVVLLTANPSGDKELQMSAMVSRPNHRFS
jgi:hypothetical protein